MTTATQPNKRATSEIVIGGMFTNDTVDIAEDVFHGTTAPATYDYNGKTYRYFHTEFAGPDDDTVIAVIYVREGAQPRFVRVLTPNGIVIGTRQPVEAAA